MGLITYEAVSPDPRFFGLGGGGANLSKDENIEGPDAEGWDSFDATLLRAVDELYIDSFICDSTWQKLSEKYNMHQLIDLIFTIGQYNLVSMVLNTLGVQLEEGVEGFPK